MNEKRTKNTAPKPRTYRSTLPRFGDCAEVLDDRGKKWRYCEPSDTWALVLEHDGISSTSARSYQKLWYEFGPLEVVSMGTPE